MKRFLPILLFVVAGVAGWLVVLLAPDPSAAPEADLEPEATLKAPPVKLSKAAPAPKRPAEQQAPSEGVTRAEAPAAPTAAPAAPPKDPLEMTTEERREQMRQMLKVPPHLENAERSEQRRHFEVMLDNQEQTIVRFKGQLEELEGKAERTEQEEKQLEQLRRNTVIFEDSIVVLKEILDDWRP